MELENSRTLAKPAKSVMVADNATNVKEMEKSTMTPEEIIQMLEDAAADEPYVNVRLVYPNREGKMVTRDGKLPVHQAEEFANRLDKIVKIWEPKITK